MLKKILLAVLVAAPLFVQAQTVKFGALNPQEILNVMPEMTTANNTLSQQKEYEDLLGRYQTFRQTAQQDMQRQQETLFAPIQQKLMNAIQAVGAEGHYAGILDSSSLLYRGDNIEDISAKVKAKLGIK